MSGKWTKFKGLEVQSPTGGQLLVVPLRIHRANTIKQFY